MTAELIRSERTYCPGIAEWVQGQYDLLKDLKKWLDRWSFTKKNDGQDNIELFYLPL